MKTISYMGLLLLVLSGCASTGAAPRSPSTQNAMVSCEELASGDGGPTDPNSNEVRRANCR